MASTITHHGTIEFSAGGYTKTAGSNNWTVEPIPAFGLESPPPLGQVLIRFDAPNPAPYTVLVCASRVTGTPMVAANWGDADDAGFVVNLWETVADRTVVNASFSFVVLE